MLRLSILLLASLLLLTQCRPCRWNSCGCDYDTNSGLQVIEQLDARFGTGYDWGESTSFYSWNVAAITFRVARYSPLAIAPPKSHWSFIPTANACDPAFGYQQATTYFTDVIVIAEQADSLQNVSWRAGDTISNYFRFGESYDVKAIPAFLASHDRIYVGNEFQLRLNQAPGAQKRIPITVHLKMSGGTIYSFPDLEMRVF